jgi:hypothetical protein
MPPPVAEAAPVSARGAAAGAVIWSAFLSAAAGTVLCFAFVDPQALASGDPPSWWSSRTRVYAIGFFFFWLIGLLAAALSRLLARPADTASR